MNICRDDLMADEAEGPLLEAGKTEGDPALSVSISLIDTSGLQEIADSIREKDGFLPLVCAPCYQEKKDCELCLLVGRECDPSGWYNFEIQVSRKEGKMALEGFVFTLAASAQKDNEKCYEIPVGGQEEMILEAIDEECRRAYGQSLKELLDEAERDG